MKLVTSMGAIYRLTDKEYRKVLRSIACGGWYEMPEGRMVGKIDAYMSDITEDEARRLLLAEVDKELVE